jgi:hypothetical protein
MSNSVSPTSNTLTLLMSRFRIKVNLKGNGNKISYFGTFMMGKLLSPIFTYRIYFTFRPYAFVISLNDHRIVLPLNMRNYQSRWPRCLRRGSAVARLLALRVLSGRGLCDGPIPCPEESYSVCVCMSLNVIRYNNKAVNLQK